VSPQSPNAPEGVCSPETSSSTATGNYVGATSWNPQTSAALVLPFGRDSLVRVKVDRAKDRNGSGGLIGQRKRARGERSLHTHEPSQGAVELLVLESSPVSTSDQIKVEANRPEAHQRKLEERQGVVAWARAIAPNETLKFSVTYAIGYPKEAAVVGLLERVYSLRAAEDSPRVCKNRYPRRPTAIHELPEPGTSCFPAGAFCPLSMAFGPSRFFWSFRTIST